MMRAERRQHFAVWLTSDEAQYLNRNSHNRIAKGKCCPHLEIFHNEGRTRDGGEWRSCQIDGCGCVGEYKGCRTDCYNCGFDPTLDRIATRNMALGVALGAMAFGALIGWLVS